MNRNIGPLPWTSIGTVIYDANGVSILNAFHEGIARDDLARRAENLRHTVRAVNAYDALVKTLSDTLPMFQKRALSKADREQIEAIRAALKAAEGGEGWNAHRTPRTGDRQAG